MDDDIDPLPAFDRSANFRRVYFTAYVHGIAPVDPSGKAGSGYAIERRRQQSFVEPSGCYQRGDGQS